MNNKRIVTRYNIYIGLNDMDEYEQKFDTETYMRIAKYAAHIYAGGFTISKTTGGFVHENGVFVEENSIVISLFDANETQVEELATNLCTFFKQESVLVTKENVEMYEVQNILKQ